MSEFDASPESESSRNERIRKNQSVKLQSSIEPPFLRKFTLADGLILVAAIAVGLMLARHTDLQMSVGGVLEGGGTVLDALVTCVYIGFKVSAPFVAVLTLALLILQLRAPRVRWLRLTRQPGMTACLAAAFVMLLGTVLCWPYWKLSSWIADMSTMNGAVLEWTILSVHPIGIAVASVWFVQIVSSRWRPVSHWLDCCGRLLGYYWLVELLCGQYWNVSGWI